MRAERDRRAAILNAEGVKQSQILTADGDRQGAILRAQGEREARILQAEGQAKAIQTVFNAVHAADPDPKVLAYQYLQALPQIAAGSANKLWIIPAEMTKSLEGISQALTGILPGGNGGGGASRRRPVSRTSRPQRWTRRWPPLGPRRTTRRPNRGGGRRWHDATGAE